MSPHTPVHSPVMTTTHTSPQPQPLPDVGAVVASALGRMRATMSVALRTEDTVVVNTGRCFPDGDPLRVRVWIPPSPGTTVAVGDGGATYARLGSTPSPDYALSVRRELLEELPVMEVRGQIVVLAPLRQVSDAITLLADSCLVLDAAVIVAKHMRPRL